MAGENGETGKSNGESRLEEAYKLVRESCRKLYKRMSRGMFKLVVETLQDAVFSFVEYRSAFARFLREAGEMRELEKTIDEFPEDLFAYLAALYGVSTGLDLAVLLLAPPAALYRGLLECGEDDPSVEHAKFRVILGSTNSIVHAGLLGMAEGVVGLEKIAWKPPRDAKLIL
ncbi:MAG: hypothetical protein F7C35_03400 [Desulfurococcales archaeon]|nr:hypothetical protein [Desulfurococcales archaeon]